MDSGLLTMSQCSFIVGKKCTILVSDVDNGECYAYGGTRRMWEIFVPPTQFCCTLNCSKNKVLINKYIYVSKLKLKKKNYTLLKTLRLRVVFQYYYTTNNER